MQPAFFVFLKYCSTASGYCQQFFLFILYIFPAECHTKPIHRYKKEVFSMAKNNQNQNKNQNQNQNKNQQEQNKQAKECN